MAVGYSNPLAVPFGLGVPNTPAAATVGFTSLFWWMGGVGGTPAAETDTPINGKVRRDDSHLVDYYRRRKLLEEAQDEPEKPPLEIVKIGKAPNETITGLVQPARAAQPKPTLRSLALEQLAESQFNAERLRGKKLRQLQQADDEWLMLN